MNPRPARPAPIGEPRVTSIGEFHLAGDPERLVIYGLGSCVAVLLHDPTLPLSCLGHMLLPDPKSEAPVESAGRFASTAVPAMLESMRRSGSEVRHVTAKLAGGAEMFRYERSTDPDSVGNRNVQAALAVLERLGIPVVAQDTGGTHGRTIFVDARSGRMEVRALRIAVRML